MSDSIRPLIMIDEINEAMQALAIFRRTAGQTAGGTMLFLSGPEGCGKTELVRHHMRELSRSHPKGRRQVQFAAQLVAVLAAAESERRLHSVFEELAELDLLVLDECEWIDGRLVGQALVRAMIDRFQWDGPGLIFVSRKPVKNFERLLPQLANRWQGAVNVSIDRPGPVGREVLLRSFAAERQLGLSGAALKLLRDELDVSPRELRDIIHELNQHARLKDGIVDLALAERYLAGHRGESIELAEAVLKAVSLEFGITIDDLTSRSRQQGHVLPRQCAMLLMRELTGQPLEQIGTALGNRNRTTISHGCDRVEKLLPELPALRQRINRLRQTLRKARRTRGA